MRLLNCRTDCLLVKLLPHNFELGPSDPTVRDLKLPLLVLQLTPLYENRNFAEQSSPLISASFCSHPELTAIKVRFCLSLLLITLHNATGFSRTLAIVLCGFWIVQMEVSVLPGMIILSIDTLKAFLELHLHRGPFFLRKIVLLLIAFSLMHV